MTVEQVRVAVLAVARQAFAAGLRVGRQGKGTGVVASEAKALTYAEQLVMPLVEMAIEEAVEQAATAWIEERAACAPLPEDVPPA